MSTEQAPTKLTEEEKKIADIKTSVLETTGYSLEELSSIAFAGNPWAQKIIQELEEPTVPGGK